MADVPYTSRRKKLADRLSIIAFIVILAGMLWMTGLPAGLFHLARRAVSSANPAPVDGYIAPLSFVEGAQGVTAERELSIELPETKYVRNEHGGSTVKYVSSLTDVWTLKNSSSRDASVTVAWPAVDRMGTISVELNGEAAEPEVRVGCLEPDLRAELASGEAEARLRGELYFENVLAGTPALDDIVTVFAVHTIDSKGHGQVALRLDRAKDGERMYTYGAEWSESDGVRTAAFRCSYFGASGYVVLTGVYTGGYTLRAAEGSGDGLGRVLDSVKGTAYVRRYTTTMGALLRSIAAAEYSTYTRLDAGFADMVGSAACFCFAKWSEDGVPGRDFPGGSYVYRPLTNLDTVLETAKGAAYSGVSWRLTTLTVPAGGSATLSYSFGTSSITRFLLTGPGEHSVPCTGLTLNVTPRGDEVSMVKNNLGLRREGGTVELDPARDDCYLRIK